jgi:hypothetical protein
MIEKRLKKEGRAKGEDEGGDIIWKKVRFALLEGILCSNHPARRPLATGGYSLHGCDQLLPACQVWAVLHLQLHQRLQNGTGAID